ncbi:hypothetical protein HOLleu_45249 [Holothuria leucospilota]|uniref:Uncharacterized protein n=1 Tax=Holothuria leucospilota TaxID=206669 RepID=A0A9Q1BAG8_HOLLE|nr:hypothetical protein HOLleu_45249 [Holothuria leucospilota]
MASSKSTVPTQSTLVSFFNKIPVTLSSFVSSQTFQIPKSTAPVTTTSASSPFAGFSFQTTPSKKDTPSLFGSNTSSTLLASTEHTVTTQSPPPSLSLASHLTSTIPTVTTQSRFAGFSFNKTPDTSSSFASSQTFQISKSTVSVTTTSTSPLFAGLSFQTTPSKKDPPSLFGSNTSATQLASTKPTVTTQSPPPSQFLDFHVASSKSMETTQSRFAGFSFNKTPGTSASFAPSQTFQIPQSPAAVTTTSTSSCFASGFSFRNTPSKKGTPNLFGLNTSSQPSKDGSAALQYPHLKAPLIGDTNKEEEGNVESLRSGFLSPSQSCETSQRKPGESLMGVTSSAPQKKEDKSNTTPLKGKDDNSDNDDVIFMGEVKATPEQVAKAEKLMLPPNFYLYEQCPPCPGCRGCDEEDNNKPVVVEHKLSTLCPEKPKGEWQ